MAGASTRILPTVTTLTEPYWTGCREGELRLQYCGRCGDFQFYPRILCSHCGHDGLAWRAVSGGGRIASYTVMYRPVSDAYPSPTVVALVDLDEGPRMMSNVIDSHPERVAVGARVRVDFEAWSEDISMPVFRVLAEDIQS
jgi:uncharacterized OB-fold protein